MSFIVEDGTGLATANAYISVADCDTYQAEFIRNDWASLSNDLKELYIKQATKWIDNNYSFDGTKNSREQALSFPRTYCYDKDGYLIDSDIVPKEIENATCEVAYLYVSNSSVFDTPERLTRKEKVDVLEVEYIENQSEVNNFLEIDQILTGLINNDTLSNKLERV